jgi:hypothetical protein
MPTASTTRTSHDQSTDQPGKVEREDLPDPHQHGQADARRHQFTRRLHHRRVPVQVGRRRVGSVRVIGASPGACELPSLYGATRRSVPPTMGPNSGQFVCGESRRPRIKEAPFANPAGRPQHRYGPVAGPSQVVPLVEAAVDDHALRMPVSTKTTNGASVKSCSSSGPSMWLGAAHRPGLGLRRRCRVPGGSTMMTAGQKVRATAVTQPR